MARRSSRKSQENLLNPEGNSISDESSLRPRKCQDKVPGKSPEMTQEPKETYKKLTKTFRQAIQVKLKPMLSFQDN
jgi:hypothetical protein